jgi:hypothetical protein
VIDNNALVILKYIFSHTCQLVANESAGFYYCSFDQNVYMSAVCIQLHKVFHFNNTYKIIKITFKIIYTPIITAERLICDQVINFKKILSEQIGLLFVNVVMEIV